MDERIPPGTYFQYSSSGVHSSPHHSMRSPASSERERSAPSHFQSILGFLDVGVGVLDWDLIGHVFLLRNSGVKLVVLVGGLDFFCSCLQKLPFRLISDFPPLFLGVWFCV